MDKFSLFYLLRLIRIRKVHKCSQLLLYGAKRPIPRS
jgi:hypothetical protein